MLSPSAHMHILKTETLFSENSTPTTIHGVTYQQIVSSMPCGTLILIFVVLSVCRAVKYQDDLYKYLLVQICKEFLVGKLFHLH